jgi:hypothetical protein
LEDFRIRGNGGGGGSGGGGGGNTAAAAAAMAPPQVLSQQRPSTAHSGKRHGYSNRIMNRRRLTTLFLFDPRHAH